MIFSLCSRSKQTAYAGSRIGRSGSQHVFLENYLRRRGLRRFCTIRSARSMVSEPYIIREIQLNKKNIIDPP